MATARPDTSTQEALAEEEGGGGGAAEDLAPAAATTAPAEPAPLPAVVEVAAAAPAPVQAQAQAMRFMTFRNVDTPEQQQYEQSIIAALAKGEYVPGVCAHPPPPPMGERLENTLTATEYRARLKAYREALIRERTQDFKRARREWRKDTSYFGVLKASLFETAFHIGNIVEKCSDVVAGEYHDKMDDMMAERFAALNLPEREALSMDFRCSVLSGGAVVTGYVTVTTHFLIFDGTGALPSSTPSSAAAAAAVSPSSSPAPAAPAPAPTSIAPRFALPLRQIVSVQRAVTVPAADGTLAPVFAVTTAPNKGDAVLIFTADGRLHHFYGFTHYFINWYSDFLVTLDQAWRNLADPATEQQ
eukprot:TRINITY_DN8329_c4_g1_i1.p1 TRINITY_DN8329_c4_g1~~TRINITY_DN8329_c4_g1_i1.p1  ORF type:complete len:377 (-),score=112.79 TRINITY_DN8329_c4_g1_i1:56-1132(-)